jgi:hypothetical protein
VFKSHKRYFAYSRLNTTRGPCTLGAEDFEALQQLIGEHPRWSRRRLSIALCEVLNWRTASGQLKDMSAPVAVEQAGRTRVHQVAATAAAMTLQSTHGGCARDKAQRAWDQNRTNVTLRRFSPGTDGVVAARQLTSVPLEGGTGRVRHS